jgi:hypothetical protein
MDPGNTKISMGATVKASTDIAHTQQSANQERQDQLQLGLNQQKAQTTELSTSIPNQLTQVIQTTEALIFSALDDYWETSNFDSFRQTVTSELAILADQIRLKFEETMESVEDVNGDLQQTVETLSKHFDFGIDGLTIKAGENAMSLKLDNGLVSFWKNGQQFGWWDGVDFHTGNIIIDVNERAQFGNFAAIPRSNGGLSWLKVKG